jgi:hypothetical protein
MPTTYDKIQSVTVGSGGVPSVEFTSIPQTYTDLIVKVSGRDGDNNFQMNMIFNNSGSATNIYAQATGTGANAGTQGDMRFVVNASSTQANTFGVMECYIADYTSSINPKPSGTLSATEGNTVTAYMRIGSNTWPSASAVTAIKFQNVSGGNVPEFCTFYLYGIKKN